MSKAKKVIRAVLIVLLALIVVVSIAGYIMFKDIIKGARSVVKLDEDLYYMNYEGDYGFDEFLAEGGASSDAKMADYIVKFLSHGFYEMETETAEAPYGCATVKAYDDSGNTLWGRNFDWESCQTIIVHTKPENGYESYSTCDLEFLGFGYDYYPDESMASRIMAVASIYAPLDGFNEKGLMVADLISGDKTETHQDTNKPDLTTVSGLRLILDHAATVDEAVDLLSTYDMNSSIGAGHHYSICDSTGKSVVVEYVNNEMIVTETDAVTNHILADCKIQGIGSNNSHKRFNTLVDWLEEDQITSSLEENGTPLLGAYVSNNKKITESDGVVDALSSIKASINNDEGVDSSDEDYEISVWTIIYEPSKNQARFYFKENYDTYYLLELGENHSITQL